VHDGMGDRKGECPCCGKTLRVPKGPVVATLDIPQPARRPGTRMVAFEEAVEMGIISPSSAPTEEAPTPDPKEAEEAAPVLEEALETEEPSPDAAQEPVEEAAPVLEEAPETEEPAPALTSAPEPVKSKPDPKALAAARAKFKGKAAAPKDEEAAPLPPAEKSKPDKLGKPSRPGRPGAKAERSSGPKRGKAAGTCPKCGAELADPKAKSCAGCGAPIKKKGNPFLKLLMALIMAVVLTGGVLYFVKPELLKSVVEKALGKINAAVPAKGGGGQTATPREQGKDAGPGAGEPTAEETIPAVPAVSVAPDVSVVPAPAVGESAP